MNPRKDTACSPGDVGDAGTCAAEAVYLALGINMAGEKELLAGCIWIAQTERARIIPFFDYPPKTRKVSHTNNISKK